MNDNGWMPIETAPEGEFLLIASCEGLYVAWRDSQGYWQYSDDEFVDAPTHWQPLPAPPTGEDA